MSHTEHRQAAPKVIRCHVITVSDTRTEETDVGGRTVVDLLTGDGHEVLGKSIVADDPGLVQEAVEAQLANLDVQVVVTTGGTGISSRDQTYEAVNGLLDKRIDGFGELFRALSYEEIGTAAMLSRALAGTARGKVLISIPGSVNAVRLAVTKLILPEIGHLVREASR
jgi:molybdenum cofactor biosynthesis protein B